MDRNHLVPLDPDHPGFRDPVYRARRDAIARIAYAHETGDAVPDAPYTDAEHGVWAAVRGSLDPLHQRLVTRSLTALQPLLGMGASRIPQLRELNAALARHGDFRMEPVAGLVDPETFLVHLGQGVFLSTQYIRHASRPFYTPEPDVVHELIGHAASLLHPRLAATSRRFGRCAAEASPEGVMRLTRVYWYTLEFGLCEEDGRLVAMGAGLMSSVGELQRSVEGEGVVREVLDIPALAERAYDPTSFQPSYAVGPSFEGTLDALDAWLDSGGWRAAG
jgi:phenylalanine-4-hydroxylase